MSARGFKTAVFAAAPMLPVFIMLVVSSMLFQYGYVARHLDIVAGPAFPQQYVDLEKRLDAVREALTDTRILILQRPDAAVAADAGGTAPVAQAPAVEPSAQQQAEAAGAAPNTFEAQFAEAARRLVTLTASVKQAAVPVLDAARPVALSGRPAMIGLRDANSALDSEVGLVTTAVAGCECPGFEKDTVSAVVADLSRTVSELKTVLTEWATAKARQSGAMMKAANATVILIIVTVGALCWSIAYLLPSRLGGPELGAGSAVRVAFIVAPAVLFLAILLVPYLRPQLPLVPYREIMLNLFERTLLHGLAPGYEWFLRLNYAAIGLAAAALLAAYGATAAAAWSYDYADPPGNAVGAIRRMVIVRNSLYSGALVCVASLIAIQSDFTAAASLFAAGAADALNPTRTLIEEIGSAIVQATGIGLGLALAAAYLPAAAYLYPAYQTEKAAAAAGSPQGSFSLLDSGGFGMVLRFLAIIAPALIEPISKALGGE